MISLSSLDARIKLLLLFMLSSTALFVRRAEVLLALLLLTLLILLTGGIKWRRLWRQARGALSLALSLFILQCLFNRGGEPLLSLGGLTLLYAEGWRISLLVTLRLLIIISSALIILSGETRDYLLALTQCRLPYELAYMTLAALRFLPLLRDEANAVLNAAQMRGLDIRNTPLVGRLRLYAGLLIPIVAAALERAGQMSLAMEARAFRAYPRRTYWRQLRLTKTDIGYMLVFVMIFALILLLI